MTFAIFPKGEYPANWPELSTKAKEAAHWTCEHCGMKFNTDGKALDHFNADGQPAVLTVHHIDGNKSDCSKRNLLVCCQACHLHIQALWGPGQELPATWHPVPEWIISRGLTYKPSSQLRLF